MRTFVFTAAGSSYALDASWIQAVHPLVRARPVPGTPAWLAGVIDVHGELVPMVDAAMLLSGTATVQRTLGARILLVDTGIGQGGARARFALAVDRVLDAVALEQDGGWRSGAGVVLQHGGEAVQVLDPLALAAANPQLAAPAGGELAGGTA
jgi:hypothetical protein